MDLDINNYELKDILHLFKLPTNFNESHLKETKRLVLKVHPDKSGLAPEYFIFYSKAYKMLYSIWEFRKNSYNDKEKNTEYTIDGIMDSGKSKILDRFFEEKTDLKDNKNFNSWFNQEFEKSRIQNEVESKGYGDWLKSSEGFVGDADGDTTMSEESFSRKKRELREKTGTMTEYQEIQELNFSPRGRGGFGDELDTSAPSSFGSGMFSQLQYEDLQKAYTETIIPVTEEDDFDKRHQFKSLDEIKQHRNRQDTMPLSEQQALQYLSNKTKSADEKSVKVAYDLQKQLEQTKQRNQDFWKGLQLLN